MTTRFAGLSAVLVRQSQQGTFGVGSYDLVLPLGKGWGIAPAKRHVRSASVGSPDVTHSEVAGMSF